MEQQVEQPASIISGETYGLMLKALLETEKDLSDEISANYGMVDYRFLQDLDAHISTADSTQLLRLEAIKTAVTDEMQKRMAEAAQTLKEIVSSPTPVVMEGRMAALARQGRVDDALLQLLEANLQQAREAGEAGKAAVTALSSLQKRVQTELDTKIEPRMLLLRQLLRMDSKPARLSLLKQKMKPKESTKVVIATTLEAQSQDEPEDLKPEIDPRELSQAISELKLRFGNVDEQFDTGFVAKLDAVAAEAEEVALELAGGREITAKEQQDMMWNQGTVSVWDLEAVEEEAHQNNGYAVWEPEGQKIVQADNEARLRGIQQQGQ